MSDRGPLSAQMSSFVEALSECKGPVLGLDVGLRHIGVALSDERHLISFPRGGFGRASIREDIASMRKITGLVEMHAAVVGMPTCSGRTASYAKVQDFSRAYAQGVLPECGIRVIAFWDESYTTQLAKDSFMGHAKKRDRNRLATRKRVVDGVSG